MGHIFLIGIGLSVLLVVANMLMVKNTTNQTNRLTWKKCFFYGTQIYLLSLIFGSLATTIGGEAYECRLAEFSFKLIIQSGGLLVYAIIFTVFPVLPALIVGLRAISKSGLNQNRKLVIFVGVNAILVLFINLVMSDFLVNWEMTVFLSGYSIFGIATPLVFAKMRKVFLTGQKSV